MTKLAYFKDKFLFINTNDHNPPHIHVVKKGKTLFRIAFDNNGDVYILKEDTLKDMTNSDYKVLVAWMHNNIDLLRDF